MTSYSCHKLAAAFAGLGFRVVLNETEVIELQSWRNLRFEVSDTSLLYPAVSRDDLYRGWREGTLAKLDATHPFLCGIYAGQNMEALMKLQATGERYALRPVCDVAAAQPLHHYLPGEEDARLTLAAAAHGTRDLPLAAACGVVGLPVIDIDGDPGQRRYLMPDTSHWHIQPSLLPLVAVRDYFPRIQPGKPDLALGLTHPQHPLIAAYNGAYAYGVLSGQLRTLRRRLLVKDPYSDRRALIPQNPSAALEDEVRHHFKIPA